MQNVKQLLVVVDRSERAGNILEKAAMLAAANDARVHVIRVIYENLAGYGKMSADDTQALKLFIMQAEEEYLDELLNDFKNRFSDLSSATIWNKRVSTAVLDVVADLGIDFVVKSTHTDAPHLPRHPDDWNLIREARCPVLLVGAEPWSDRPAITAAVDALDVAHEEINRRILDAADSLATNLNGILDVVSAFPRLEPWSSDVVVGLDFVRLKHELEQEVRARASELVEGLVSEVKTVRAGEGTPSQVIKNLTDQSGSDVIVVGTAARKGVSAWVIGNTSEVLLDQVARDLLILPV